MNDTLEKTKEDIAPRWVELSQSVRRYAASSLEKPGDENAAKALASEALALCDHVDRLHDDLRGLLGALEAGDVAKKKSEPTEDEIDMAAVEEHHETHETPDEPLDILKALLMWRNDPADRVE